jgi:NADPH:quinone reductase-like Zn-dependent oxidoreductase
MVAMTEAGASTGATTMRAAIRDRYGSPDVVRVDEVERPELVADGVLVRVLASSVNRGDWYAVAGRPLLARPMMGGVRRPKSQLLGSDFAGVVEAVGRDVHDLVPGDAVFGGKSGAFAEYVCVRNGVARKPERLSFEEAAAVPVAALTALQALRDKAELREGQRVLVNGASGGVGTFAVQIAKALGAAEVTAVCSTRNVEQARELGADRVVDYTRADFTETSRGYDVLFENAGTISWAAARRVMAPGGTMVLVGAKQSGALLGPLRHIARIRVAALRGSQKAVFFVAEFNREDVNVLRELLESGRVNPVVERVYGLDEVPEALRAMGEGHARGKLVISV